jgi:hypothetical protein
MALYEVTNETFVRFSGPSFGMSEACMRAATATPRGIFTLIRHSAPLN